jgi:hypothetical protein
MVSIGTNALDAQQISDILETSRSECRRKASLSQGANPSTLQELFSSPEAMIKQAIKSILDVSTGWP